MNSLDPDPTRQNVGPDLDPNCLTLTVFPARSYSSTIGSETSLSRRTFVIAKVGIFLNIHVIK